MAVSYQVRDCDKASLLCRRIETRRTCSFQSTIADLTAEISEPPTWCATAQSTANVQHQRLAIRLFVMLMIE